MKKIISYLLVALAFCAGAQTLPVKERAAKEKKLRRAVPARMVGFALREGLPDIYGWLRYDERNQDEYGICRFNAATPANVEVLFPFDQNTAACAGAFANGKYYAYLYAPNDGGATPLSFGTVDLVTGEYAMIKDYRGLNTLFSDMAYDYSSGTMYAIGSPGGGEVSLLLTVDLETGDIATVANLGEKFVSLACSYDGKLYAVKGDDGYLYSIGKDGTVAEIGYTWEEPEGAYLQSMEFDHCSETLYWAGVNIYEEGFLAKIDLNTGEATRLGIIGNNAQVVGLHIPFVRVAENAPAAVSDFTVVPAANGVLSARLSWTNPSETSGGLQLASIDRVEIFRNDELVHTLPDARPGGNGSWTDNSIGISGLATYRIVAVNSEGGGLPVSQTVFVGRDVPVAPSGVAVESQSASIVDLKWNPVSEGLHGGWIDAATLAYRIVRLPDNKALAEACRETSYKDNDFVEFGSYSYEITALTEDGKGGSATSGSVLAGPPVALPYSCAFSTDEEFAMWTVVDANRDGQTWKRETTLDAALYTYSGTESGNDWLISPPFSLQKGKVYRLRFKLQSYGETSPEKMSVHLGQGVTVDAMTMELGNYTVTNNKFQEHEIILPELQEDGMCHLGFRCYSDPDMFKLYLTDVAFDCVETGTIEGTVTDGASPLGNVAVSLQNTDLSAVTDANGHYRMEDVESGDYAVAFECPGYARQQKDMTVTAGGIHVVDAVLEKLSLMDVKGIVVNETGNPVQGASITISAYEDYAMESAADGSFSFTGVKVAGSAELTIERYGLRSYEQELELSAVADLGEVLLEDKLLPPYGLKAEAIGEEVALSWQMPFDSREFRHDSGEHGGRIGKTDGVANSVFGAVFRTPSRLTGMSWYSEKFLQEHPKINVFVFDLDVDGNPTSSILYSQKDVANEDDSWNVLSFPEPIDAPNGYMLAVSCEGHVGLGLDTGMNPDYPFEERTNCYSDDYATGEFIYTEEHDIRRSMMIRAAGCTLSDAMLPDASSPKKYNVWRMRQGEETDETAWTLLTAEPQNAMNYVDAQWKSMPQGFYRYAVKTVYADGEMSAGELSDPVASKMLADVSITVRTNTPANESEGSKVVLACSDGDASHVYEAEVGSDGVCRIPGIWKGIYRIEIKKRGFVPVVAENVDFSTDDTYSLSYSQDEYVVEPFNLEIFPTGETGQRLFSWNTTHHLFDDFEAHEDFAIDSPGETGWEYVDGDGSPVYSIDGVDYANAEAPMAFMVFNPFRTDPVLGVVNDFIRPHSGNKYLAAFASARSRNDDYFISPKLDFTKEFTFKFYAKSCTGDYGMEEMNVGYSTTGTDASDFVWLNGETPVELPADEWMEYRYTIPATAKHVAINCVSPQVFMMMVDDVFVGVELPEDLDVDAIREDLSFEVYLDGKKMADTGEKTYLFSGLSPEKHRAGVKAVFASTTTPMVEVEFDLGDSSVKGVVENGHVAVYPNPTQGEINISGDYDYAVVFNISGKQVGRFPAGEKIDIGGCPAGLYVVRIVSQERVSTEKILLTK